MTKIQQVFLDALVSSPRAAELADVDDLFGFLIGCAGPEVRGPPFLIAADRCHARQRYWAQTAIHPAPFGRRR
jgi:hypothetical protein